MSGSENEFKYPSHIDLNETVEVKKGETKPRYGRLRVNGGPSHGELREDGFLFDLKNPLTPVKPISEDSANQKNWRDEYFTKGRFSSDKVDIVVHSRVKAH